MRPFAPLLVAEFAPYEYGQAGRGPVWLVLLLSAYRVKQKTAIHHEEKQEQASVLGINAPGSLVEHVFTEDGGT